LATLTIRNLDDDLVAALKQRARRNNRSLEAELRTLLRDAAGERSLTSLRELADQIAALTPDVPQADSAALMRDDRDR
jgi:plasmid stability protein